MSSLPVAELAENARTWGEHDNRIAALIIYGSLAQGQANELSDLDLLVVARPGEREMLWAERAIVAAYVLGEPQAWHHEPYWQRAYRYQAWRTDLAAVDLTMDEGSAQPWNALAEGFDVLLDREDVGARLRADLAGWEPAEVDTAAFDGVTWVWLYWLLGRLRHDELWLVRCNLTEVLRHRVLPLLGSADHEEESALHQKDRDSLHAAAPSSEHPHELARALRATGDLYDRALTRWASRTGQPRPENPLRPAVLEYLHRL